ncbi:MAG: FAD-dependent oxidoreductase, partial [Pseudonocardiales bacterium]|nr:FAD-dependent oxidoreductase [Pseudonocardiales bacterium]
MRTVVVAGHGMVGHRLVEALIGRDVRRQWRIVVLAEEGRPAYDRVALSTYVDSWNADALALPAVADDRVELRLGDPCVAIDRRRRRVRTASGHRVAYDALVLATGSAPFVPPVPGHNLPGCYVYRTPEDLDAIRAAAQRAMHTSAAGRRSGVVVGGGLLGLEAAYALRQLGLSPHVVEIAPRLMPMQVDEGGGALLRRFIEGLGVRVYCGNATKAIEQDRGRLLVRLSDETELDTDVVVFSAGVRPRDQLAREAKLPVGERGGVLVDASCRTSDEDIWAIGECAAVEGRCYGLVAPGYAMAEVVADRLLGGNATFPGADTSTKLKLLGVDVASFGDAHAQADGALEVIHNDPVAGRYAKLVVSDDARTLLGGVLVGDAEAYGTLRALVGAALPADPGALIAPSAGELDAAALPATAQVCSCHAVTVATITSAVTQQGCTTVPALKACTKAGTGCGSCVPMLKKLLAAQGVEQSKALCEHFAHSRAELFEIVAATRIRTFSELVAKHGTGRGCDICKPAVASILASLSG